MRKRSKTLKYKTFKRDKFICQKCGFEDKTGLKLEAHHINPLYLGGADDINNLITLCFDCHHYAPDEKQEFEEYMKEEMEGTLTILMKSWEKTIKENPDLINKINNKNL